MWPFASPPPWAAHHRHLRSTRAVEVLRTEIEEWLATRRADPVFARFAGHLAVLQHVLRAMLDAVAAELSVIDPRQMSNGPVYELCRAADHRTALIRRTHGWYADKYDQRLGPAAEVMCAADEVVRSCWSEAFAALGRPAPTGPLCYLDARFDAHATPRVSVPSDLRAPGDAVVGALVRELPVPVVALPALCVDEPWWLVLTAHETGHHVQHDLVPGLVAATRTALAAAVDEDAADGNSARAECWASWSMESFADAFAALTVGSAAAWPVGELQHAGIDHLLTPPSPGRRYPPPPVRAALLGELAEQVGAVDSGPRAADVLHWLGTLPAGARTDDEEMSAHVRLTPRIAAALVALPVDGVALRGVCGWEPDSFTADGPVAVWAAALRTGRPVSGRGRRGAARYGVAGAVQAYRQVARDGGDPVDLRTLVPSALAGCGPSGHLAAAPARSLAESTRRATSRLLAAHPDDPREL